MKAKSLHKKSERSTPNQDDAFSQTLIDNLKDFAVLSVNREGVITSWNSSAETLFGYKAKEVIGTNSSFMYTAIDRSENVPQKELTNAMKKEQTMPERLLIRKNKPPFWASETIFPVQNVHGVHIGYTKIISDISKQKEFERRREEFIVTATHEIRTPLTTMKLFADIITDKTKKSKSTTLKDSVLGLNHQINHLIALTNFLLDMSEIQRGKMQLHEEVFDLKAVIDLLVTTLKPTSTKHSFVIRSKGAIKAYADKERINQVLTNLLSNAIKYSPKGGKIIITCSEHDNGIKVAIRDFGLGITKDEQKKIFTRFFRAETARKTDITGVGLGLYIARKIIVAHRGEIGLTSSKGNGSTFFFTLPNKPE